jgi:hypothetical protein
MILSGLLSLVLGFVVLYFFFESSVFDTDQKWGWALIFCTLTYLASPTLIYWLVKNAHKKLAIGLCTVFITFISGLFFVLFSWGEGVVH